MPLRSAGRASFYGGHDRTFAFRQPESLGFVFGDRAVSNLNAYATMNDFAGLELRQQFLDSVNRYGEADSDVAARTCAENG